MPSKQSTIDYILEQISLAGTVSARKMFGGHVIYCEGKVVALVGDDQLFVKVTDAGKAFLVNCPQGPPYPGAKDCFIISNETLDDAEFMSQLVEITLLQLPNAKKRRQ